MAAAQYIDENDPSGANDDDDDNGSNSDGQDEREPRPRSKWLYLRLFYTETYLGWNAEDWSTYLLHSTLLFLLLSTVLLLLRTCFFFNVSSTI